jgi:hypothetical protein
MRDLINKAEEYRLLVARHNRAHYLAAKQAERMNTWLGVPVVVTTTAVGTTIFSTLSGNPDVRLKIGAGLLSLLAAVMASLQTFFKFSERQQKHLQAGAQYGALRRRLEIFLLRYQDDQNHHREEVLHELESLLEEVMQLERESPNPPDYIYDYAKRELPFNGGKKTS